MKDVTQSSAQRATLEIRIGKGAMRVAAELSPAGLLAIGALVSSILLSTAVLVHSARRAAARAGADRNVTRS